MTADSTEYAAPLDQLLVQAATGPVRRLLPGRAGARFVGALARRPELVATRVGNLMGELGKVVAGTSQVAPSRGDRRFADPAWTGNFLLKRAMQAYVATSETAEGLVQDVPMEWRDAEQMKFVVSNLLEAVSPSNNPLLSPVAFKAFIDTGGANAILGPRNLIRDLSSKPRVPSMVDSRAYEVGGDLAVTPGAVVYRSPVLELIQYKPQTTTVRQIPLLIVPPTINKFYVLDIAPGRSLIEYLVQQGQQVFVISWRNPDSRHSTWGFD